MLAEVFALNNNEGKNLIGPLGFNLKMFDPIWSRLNGGWSVDQKRGGEDYIPPIGWDGYGLKVKGKFDNGDDTWLNCENKEGEFSVAYFGLSKIHEKNKELLNKYDSKGVLKMVSEQTYQNDNDVKNKGIKCGSGSYLFQDPKIAENTAGIVDVGGVRYKLLLMCRVNPKKIRQPEGFQKCWILNSSLDEIRPYRILVKKIFKSPIAQASQSEIKFFPEPTQHYKDIYAKKDTSFGKKNNVIKLYSSEDYRFINNYLRNGKLDDKCPYTEAEIQSWVWCLHKKLTIETNVKDSYFYRGVARKFSN